MTDSRLLETLRSVNFNKDIIRADNNRTIHAIGTVVNYTLSDAFDLKGEESMWLGWHLHEILELLKLENPTGIQAAVKQELDTYVYSNALFNRDNQVGHVHKQTENIKYASLNDWTEAVTEIIFASYTDLRPMLQSQIIGSIRGLLEELGLSNDSNSRASLYLPNALRYIVANK